MLRRSLIAITTASALIPSPLLAASVWAPPEAAAGVLPVSFKGKLPPNGPETLTTKIEQGVGTTGTTVVSTADLAAASGNTLAGCTDEACLVGVASKASVTHLVRPSIAFDGSDYAMTIEVIDGATGQVTKTVTDTCELCGLSEAADKASALAGSLADALVVTPTTATFSLVTNPSGATVMVDGTMVGVSPLELELEPGDHQIIVQKQGYLERKRRVRLDAGETNSIDLDLDLDGSLDGDDAAPSGAWGKVRPALPWISIGVGAAALGAGIALSVIDETPVKFTRCSGNDVDHEGNCRFRHDTIVGGVVMSIVGIGGIVAGTVLLVIDKRKASDDDRRVRVRPTHNGLALRF